MHGNGQRPTPDRARAAVREYPTSHPERELSPEGRTGRPGGNWAARRELGAPEGTGRPERELAPGGPADLSFRPYPATMPALEFLDGAAVRRWCAAAAEALGAARDQINALNVFPVADRDTGTNLHLTMLSAVRALNQLPASAGPQQVWQALAHGVLLGAQGNSGVIVSQFLRGLAEICAPASPCDGTAIRWGFAHAARLSHAAVGKPVEGTVLTVAAAGAEAAAAAAGNGLVEVARAAADGARRALARTTAQLEVLTQAGVVDAGAAGLCLLLDALVAVVAGTAAAPPDVPAPTGPEGSGPEGSGPEGSGPEGSGPEGSEPAPDGPQGAAHAGEPAGYEVMYLLDAADDDVTRLRDRLGRLGDSVMVTGGAGLWHVHVHLADAGAAIEAGLAAGRPHRIRVTYLDVPGAVGYPGQAGNTAGDTGAHTVIAVAAADGIAALFREAGAMVVLRADGEPSWSQDLLAAVRSSGTRRLVVLPGAPRVALVAETVAVRVKDEGIAVTVLAAQSVVQSLSALAMHDPERGFDDDVAVMADAAAATRWGQVSWATTAQTAAQAAGQAVEQAAADATGQVAGEAVGWVGDHLVVSGGDVATVAVSLVQHLLTSGGELVTLVSGSPAGPAGPDGGEVAAAVMAWLQATRPDVEIISHEGGETGYVLQIGVE